MYSKQWFNESFELLRKIYVLFVIYLTLQLDNVAKHWEASSTSITKDVGIRVIVCVLFVCHYYSTKILDRFARGILQRKCIFIEGLVYKKCSFIQF